MSQAKDPRERRSKLSRAKRELLAKRLRDAAASAHEEQTIPRRPDPGSFPLSFAQERIWLLEQWDPGNPVYNRPVALQLAGPLEVAALKHSVTEILRRHEALRARFGTVEGQPAQIIGLPQPVTLRQIGLTDLPQEQRESEAMRLASEEAQRSFQLAEGPLARASLMGLADEEHLLLLTIHHIAFDAWSARVMIEELSTLYEAFRAAKPSPFGELRIQYADFAHWHREWLEGDRLRTLVTYWKGKLADAPPSLDLPTDRPRPATQTYSGARHAIVLPSSLVRSLRALGREQGATLFMTLLAAFKVLLHRYTQQNDIVVGSPVAGRTRPEMEKLIGLFVNHLPLRTDLSGHPTFRELLSRVREVALGAYAHQDLPFEKLVTELTPDRDLSRTPFFQVVLNLENIPKRLAERGALGIREVELDTGVAPFDLTLEIGEDAQGLSCSLLYNTDLFDADTIARAGGHFQTLLDGIAANPDQRVADLPLLTDTERHRLLVEWNATKAEYPDASCIHDLFEAQTRRTPDAVSLLFESNHITYRELDQRSSRLANYLRKHGVAPGAIVGICAERSLDMVVGLLGILRAGGAYLPLDPSYPAERLVFMLRDSGAQVLLTQRDLLGRFPSDGVESICLDDDWGQIAEETDLAPAGIAEPDSVAYVMYTSGSTGTPKGVLGTHRGAINRFSWMWRTFPFGAEEVCCQKTASSFVDSVWEAFGPLLKGVPTVIIAEEVMRDPARLISTLRDHRVTRTVMVPSLLKALLATQPELDLTLPDLKYWFTSGEELPVDLCGEFQRRMPGRKLINLYGSSEVAADVTWFDTSELSRDAATVPIGRPIANTRIHILDHYRNPVPIGVPGEIYVGGVGLATGYHNRPELTAERFTKDPFSDKAGARLYRTGDRGRYRADGAIEFLGRVDHQVQIRGFRVELGEIEAALRQHPQVTDTVVVPIDDGLGEVSIVGYVVPKGSGLPLAGDLRQFLKGKLLDYMIPSAFVMIEALPLTPNGKLDRRALPKPSSVMSRL